MPDLGLVRTCFRRSSDLTANRCFTLRVQPVLATKTHDASLHVDAPILVDVDLSILAQSPDRFWEYERAVREEYDWVETSAFNVKRTEILERFLNRERIYVTNFFFDRMEIQARVNLRASLQHLSPV